MRKLLWSTALFICVFFVSILYSCGKDNDELLLGKWNIDNVVFKENSEEVQTDEFKYFHSMEFLEGGKGFIFADDGADDDRMDATKSLNSIEFTWALENDEHLIIYVIGTIDEADFVIKELTKRKMYLNMMLADDYNEEDGTNYTQELDVYLSK